jgi:hypothetical protein
MRGFFPKKRYQIAIIAVVITMSLVSPYSAVFAQPPVFNIAQTMTIIDKEAIDGDIMSLTDKPDEITRSAKAYDEKAYGVLVDSPVMVYRTNDSIPVVRNGIAQINVTTLGGAIRIGDFITSSPIAGKAQKAEDLSGYMVAVALEAFDGKSNATQVTFEKKTYQAGKIKAAVGIGPASPALIKAAGGLFGTLIAITKAIIYNINTSKSTERLLRLILAALIALLIVYIAFRTFGKNITKGIEAIGRNPLAKGSIQAMIIMNIILIAAVSLGGIVLALIIISL